MASRLTNLIPVLAGLILGGIVYGTASAQVSRFDVDFADEDAAYFAAPESQAAATAEERSDFDVDSIFALTEATAASAEPNPLAAALIEAPVPAAVAPSSPLDSLFLLFCAALVLLMQAGFAMLEAGFNSSRNVVDNLFKNVLNLAVAGLAFFLVGYHLMFPVAPAKENIVGQFAPGIDGSITASGTSAGDSAGRPNEQVHFLYRFSLAAVAAAIVAGAVAGRMKFGASVLCGAVVAGLVYPVVGYWSWGGGWLADMGFRDFAGAGVVHLTGGVAGLAGAILLGPRLGRYTAEGKPTPIAGHSLPLATLGVFILLVGCYGLNVGGQLRISGQQDASIVGLVAANTTLAACAGCCLATGLSWILFGRPDLSMALSGLLGGLVGIAAGCDAVTNLESIAIGGVSGGAVVLAIILLDKLRVDDPVGAFPVHGVCGMWGLLAAALFGDATRWGHVGGDPAAALCGNAAAQLAGLVAIAGFSLVCMLGMLAILKTVGLLRISPEEEERGLDAAEHGLSAYAA